MARYPSTVMVSVVCPWDDDERLDETVFRREIQHALGAGFSRIYVFGTAGEGYAVIASKGGAPQHPGWYRNLLANPDVEVQVGTTKTKARARTATGPERAKLWQEALKFWPPYADYQTKTEREIPVVVLDPVR